MLFVANRCPPPPSIPNSAMSPYTADQGAVVSYTCDTGYIVSPGVTTGTLQCTDGQWLQEDGTLTSQMKCLGTYSKLV